MPSLRALFGLDYPTGEFPLPPKPDVPVCIIGDLHGMADLLNTMLAVIAVQPQSDLVRIVFTGDLIDRGPDSAKVVSTVFDLCLSDPSRYICLMGNHERMMLDFLANPGKNGKRWIAAGGGETLISYGLTARIAALTPAARFAVLAERLHAALPESILNWIAALPSYWQEEGLGVVHAGADPALPLADQPLNALNWGHPQFHRTARRDGLWIVHGHVIVPEVQIADGRIAVDTGAYSTGRLSAVWLDGDGPRVLLVKGED